MTACLPACLPVCVSVCLTVMALCLSVCVSVCLSVSLSHCLSHYDGSLGIAKPPPLYTTPWRPIPCPPTADHASLRTALTNTAL